MRPLKIGEPVVDPSGERIGELERMVVDEGDHRVSHLVVDGHVLGVNHFTATSSQALICDLDREALGRQPAEDHSHLRQAGARWKPPGGYLLENFLEVAGAIFGQATYVPPVELPEDLVDYHEITAGSPVWFQDDQLGEVERVLAEPDGGLVGLVIHPAGRRAEKKLLPAARVVEVVGNNVHTDLPPGEVSSLSDYPDERNPPGSC